MRTLWILMLACGLYGAWQWWQERSEAFDASAFVAVEMPGGMRPNTVLVLAPANCPSEQAQRSEALIRELDRAGVAAADVRLRRPTLDEVFLRLTDHEEPAR